MKKTDIHSKAMLVHVRISAWTARKFDKRITGEVNDQHAAGQDAGRWNKRLLKDAPEYNAIHAAAGRLRDYHYEQTLPWTDLGARLLPAANFASYSDGMRERTGKFQAAVAAFLPVYPNLQDADRARLNGMYRDDDYPPVGAIRGKFSVGIEFSPLPASGDFRIDLPAAQVELIEASVKEQLREKTEQAMQDAWSRLYESATKMRTRMDGVGNAAADRVMIEAAIETCDSLRRLNVTGDAKLEAMRARVEKELKRMPMGRENPQARTEAAERAASIMDKMKDFYGGAA